MKLLRHYKLVFIPVVVMFSGLSCSANGADCGDALTEGTWKGVVVSITEFIRVAEFYVAYGRMWNMNGNASIIFSSNT